MKLHHHEYVTTEGRKGINTEVIAAKVVKLNKDPHRSPTDGGMLEN